MIVEVREKFLRHRSQNKVLQHGNASSHNIADDDEVLTACHDAPVLEVVSTLKNSRI